jgi:hypothetical protein
VRSIPHCGGSGALFVSGLWCPSPFQSLSSALRATRSPRDHRTGLDRLAPPWQPSPSDQVCYIAGLIAASRFADPPRFATANHTVHSSIFSGPGFLDFQRPTDLPSALKADPRTDRTYLVPANRLVMYSLKTKRSDPVIEPYGLKCRTSVRNLSCAVSSSSQRRVIRNMRFPRMTGTKFASIRLNRVR